MAKKNRWTVYIEIDEAAWIKKNKTFDNALKEIKVVVERKKIETGIVKGMPNTRYAEISYSDDQLEKAVDVVDALNSDKEFLYSFMCLRAHRE